jgi:hypothetical protein
MSVSALTLKNMFSAYLNIYRDDLPENLKNRMTYVQQLMQQDISNVQDASQLHHWTTKMLHNIWELHTLLCITANINPHFQYENNTLLITDVVLSITDKIESMRDSSVNIEAVKRDFSPDLSHHASLYQLFHVLQQLNQDP